MTVPHELRTERQAIPDGATADDVAGIVRAILSLPVTIKKITISDEGSDGRGEIIWEALYPKVEPPDGEIPDPPPTELYEVLSRVPIEEVGKVNSPKMDMKSMRIVAGLLMMAARRRRAGVAWVVQDAGELMEWLGAKTPKPPTRFLGIQIIEQAFVPRGRLVMLMAKSSAADPLDSDGGVSIHMEAKR